MMMLGFRVVLCPGLSTKKNAEVKILTSLILDDIVTHCVLPKHCNSGKQIDYSSTVAE